MLHSGTESDDLIQNDDFIRWAITPDKQSDDYWNEWQRQEPGRADIVREAKEVVLSIYNNERLTDKILGKRLALKAWEQIDQQIEENPIEDKIRKIVWYKYAAAIAAVAVIVVGFTWIKDHSPKLVTEQNTIPALIISNLSTSEIGFTNKGDKRQVINLADGSRVTLSKNSSLHYTRLFDSNKREVYLQGEAFFEVAKDAKRPFYVYSGNVVTRVLGTSFRIISNDSLGKVTVAVRTGKVAVFRNDQPEPAKEAYTLTPNEQLIFNNKVEKPVKENIHDTSILLNEAPAPLNLNFEETSLNNVIETLATTYSVDIVNDKVKNEKCLVTVSLVGESLYDKLELLCKVAGAAYHIDGYKIYFDSKGCN